MKKEKEKPVMHHHQDEWGRVFGKPHPKNSEHNNRKTQKYHDLTIERSE